MAEDELELDEVTSLLADKKRSIKKEIARWPGEEGMELIRSAVINGEDRVTIDDREFIIQNKGNRVYSVTPVKGFVPCGGFTL